MLIPRRDPTLNAKLEVLDLRFQEAHEGPDQFSIAWDSLHGDELSVISDEIFKCKTDRRYFLENYYVIKDEHGAIQTLHPWWDHQELIFEHLIRDWRKQGWYKLIILKPRQCGGTAWAGGVVFHATIFTERAFTIQMAHDEDTSAEIYRRMWDAYNNLPWWMRPEKASKQQERHIIFQRSDEKRRMLDPGLGSTLIISNAQKAAGVAIGKTIRCGHFSEVSRWNEKNDIWTADIEPSMNARDTQAFMESTAFGRNGLFYNMWNAAEQGESDWTPVFIPVYKVRKYFTPILKGENFSVTPEEAILREKVKDSDNFTIPDGFFKWRRRKIQAAINAKGSDESHYESYPVTPGEAFISSGFCAFPRRCLNEQERENCRDPILVGEIHYNGPDRNPELVLHKPRPEELLKKPKLENRLWIWEPPEDNEAVEYYIGADVSSGDGRDYSDAPVYRIGYGDSPHEQVAEWHGLINASHFGKILAALGLWYHQAEIAVEYQQAGITTGDELRWVLDYPNIYRWKHLDKVSGVATQHIHWMTNSRTREDAINRMGEGLLDRTVVIRNRHAVGEMRDFGRFEGEIKAAGIDNNDDMVMGHIITICALHQSGKRQEWAENNMPSSGQRNQMLPKVPVVYGIYDQNGRQIDQVASEAIGLQMLQAAEKKHNIKLPWKIIPIQVSRANTVYSPIFDSPGSSESELHNLYGMSPKQIMSSNDLLARHREWMNIRERMPGLAANVDGGGSEVELEFDNYFRRGDDD